MLKELGASSAGITIPRLKRRWKEEVRGDRPWQPWFRVEWLVVRLVRLERGWTQEALAAAIGVQAASLSRIESGRIGYSITTAGDIAQVLAVPLSALVTTESESSSLAHEPSGDELAVLTRSLDPFRKDLLIRVAREIARRPMESSALD